MRRTRRTRLGRFGRALAVASLALPAVACTLLTSLNGLTGGSASDGGDGGSDAPPSFPDSPASSPDAVGDDAQVTPDDGGADGPSDAADGSIQLFFDDFDEPPSDPGDAAALAAPWDQVTGTQGKALRNGSQFVSPPYSMFIQTIASAAQVDCAGYKYFPKAATTGTYALAFQIYVQTPDDTAASDAVLTAFELLDSAGDRWALQLEVAYSSSAGLSVDFSENGTASDGGALPYRSHAASSLLPLDTWTLVTMEIDVADPDGPAATTNSATLTFGATQVAKAALHVGTVNGEPEILVGFTYAAPSSKPWSVFYDDVSLTYR